MKPFWLSQFFALLLLVGAGAAIGCGWQGQTAADNAGNDQPKPPFAGDQALVAPKGALIYIRLQQPISNATTHAGDRFSAVLDEPLIAGGQIIAPEGAPVSGKVVAARESGRLHNSGYLRVTLSALTVHGKELPMQTSSIFVEGGSYGNKNLAYTGGGGLLGALAGGGKNSFVSPGAGDSGSSSAAYATGKKEVGFVAGRRLGFRLSQPLTTE